MENKQMYYYFITILFCITLVSAYNYQTIYNPFTSNLDYHITSNMSGENITADNFFGVANSSNYWDNLNTINSTQLEDSSGELNIKESWVSSLWCKLTGCAMTGDLNMSNNNIFNVKNYTGEKINVTCCVYLGNIRAYDGNSISVQPTKDTDDYFSFKTPASRPTIKREGGKFIYFESSNVYDTGISFRADATYSGTLNYEKDTHKMTLLGKNSPVAIKTNSEYVNYFLFETINQVPQLSVFNGSKLIINDSLEVIGNLNVTGNLTNTDSWFLGKTAWATIQDKFITAVDDLYIYMSGTTATFNETKLNETIDNRDTDTTYTAGNGIALTTGAFSVAGNTALTQDADGLSVTADGIGDTQLAYNTGQHLTTTSNPQFNNITGLNCLVFSNGARLCGV